MPTKEELRKKFSLKRKKNYFEVKKNFFLPIIKIINKKNFKKIALYYPSNYELNTFELFKILNDYKGVSTLIPYLNKGSMKFIKWNLFQPLKVNNFGFLDPMKIAKPVKPDLVVLPLLAYDGSKNRLGYGKGYYDRYLRKNKNIFTIGVAFSFQKFNKIRNTNFDVKLKHILTEKGIF